MRKSDGKPVKPKIGTPGSYKPGKKRKKANPPKGAKKPRPPKEENLPKGEHAVNAVVDAAARYLKKSSKKSGS